MNTKTIGDISESQILAVLLRNGEKVLLPFGENQRYDMVIDRDGEFLRVQCKTGRYRDGVIKFPTSSVSGHTSRKNYRGQADLFGVYCPELDKIYLIPVAKTTQTEGKLRVDPPKNNQNSKITWAEDYEFGSSPD